MDYRKIVRYSLMLILITVVYFLCDSISGVFILAYLFVDNAWKLGETIVSELKRKNTIEIYGELAKVLTDCENDNAFEVQVNISEKLQKALIQKAIKDGAKVNETLSPMYGFDISLSKKDENSCDYINFEMTYIKFGAKVATEHRAKGVINFTGKSLDAMYVTVTDTGLLSQI